MATLSNPKFYYNQDSELPTSQVGGVGWGGGYGGNCTRIVRYTLTTGANDHASAINVKLISNDNITWVNGNSKADSLSELLNVIGDEIDLYFIIGTGATEHITAGKDYVTSNKYTGKASIQTYFANTGESKLDNLRFNIELDGKYSLAPNSTYYLWIFPGYAYADGTYGVFQWDDKEGTGKITKTVTLTPGHNYTSKVTAPTCTAQGYTTYTCSCGHSYKGDYKEALGHNSVYGGTKSVHTKCSRCGVTLSSTHSYTSSRAKNPTCTTKGTTKYSCACGYSYTADDVPALGHDYKGTVVAPTCTAQGYTKYKCSRCGDTSKANDSYTAALGHDYVGKVTVEPTTKAEGVMTYTCSRCGASYTEPIPKLKETVHPVYLEDGFEFGEYQVYIDNGSGWDLYEAYIDNGKNWELCGR
jgi:hypothetical protein